MITILQVNRDAGCPPGVCSEVEARAFAVWPRRFDSVTRRLVLMEPFR
jgi:hypothetical protein